MLVGLVGMFFVRSQIGVMIAGTVMMSGYMMLTAALSANIRDWTPEDKVGHFQGIRMIFQVLLPMMIGPAIGAAVIRSNPMTYEDLGQIKTVPTPGIFLGAAAVLLLVAIPVSILREKREKTDERGILRIFPRTAEPVDCRADQSRTYPQTLSGDHRYRQQLYPAADQPVCLSQCRRDHGKSDQLRDYLRGRARAPPMIRFIDALRRRELYDEDGGRRLAGSTPLWKQHLPAAAGDRGGFLRERLAFGRFPVCAARFPGGAAEETIPRLSTTRRTASGSFGAAMERDPRQKG